MNARWNEAIALLREIRDAVCKDRRAAEPLTYPAGSDRLDWTSPSQPEPPKSDADSWVPWAGGECPVDRRATISIQLRDGYRAGARDPSAFRWDHDGSDGDIIAYKLAEQTKERRPEAVAEPDWTPPPWSECPEDAEWMVLTPLGDWRAAPRVPSIHFGEEAWSFVDTPEWAEGYVVIRSAGHKPPRHIWQSSRMRRPEGV